MKIQTNPVIFILLSVLSLDCVIAITGVMSSNLSSQNKELARKKGLQIVADHVLSSTCWFNKRNIPYKIGDLLEVDGTKEGKIPTSCIYAKKTRQYLQVAYSGGILQVQNIFSKKEIEAQKQENLKLKKDKNNDG